MTSDRSKESVPRYPALDQTYMPQVVDSLVEVVRARYGDWLPEELLAQVRTGIETQISAGEKLHAYPLVNADEPAFVFVPQGEEA